MKTITPKILIILLFAVNSISAQTFIQGYQDVVNQITQNEITTNLTEFETLGVKRRGTASLQNTLNWLKSKYTSYGYTAGQMVEDSYTYPGSSAICKNLIITKTGTVYPNTFIIICGHYDSIAGTGTNDNGSGVVSILAMAKMLQNIPTEYSIKFINFSGEEDGLEGSQHFVSDIVNSTNPKMDIKFVFNIDEVGGVSDMENNTITCEKDTNGSPSTNNAASAVVTNELINCIELYSPLQTHLSYAYASDYMPFQANNEVITGLFETNETEHKHTATDFLSNMDPVYNYNVAKGAMGFLLNSSVANTTLGTTDFNENFQVSFFPNPTKEFINISMGILDEKSYQFTLTDINGKVVLEKTIQNPSQFEKIKISDLNKGIYLATLNAGEKKITKKMVIE